MSHSRLPRNTYYMPRILRLQTEIGGMFADQMDLLTLTRWRLTCKANYHQATAALRRTFISLLRPFVPFPTTLVDIVTRFHGLFGGEFALAFLLRDPQYTTDNLEIYTSDFEFDRLCDAILDDDDISSQVAEHNYTSSTLFFSLRRLIVEMLTIHLRNGKTIYIHRSYTASAAAPLTRTPCTALCNFVTALSFGCSHPLLTLQRRALLADQELFYLPHIDALTLNNMLKHGFSMVVSPAAWPEFRRQLGSDNSPESSLDAIQPLRTTTNSEFVAGKEGGLPREPSPGMPDFAVNVQIAQAIYGDALIVGLTDEDQLPPHTPDFATADPASTIGVNALHVGDQSSARGIDDHPYDPSHPLATTNTSPDVRAGQMQANCYDDHTTYANTAILDVYGPHQRNSPMTPFDGEPDGYQCAGTSSALAGTLLDSMNERIESSAPRSGDSMSHRLGLHTASPGIRPQRTVSESSLPLLDTLPVHQPRSPEDTSATIASDAAPTVGPLSVLAHADTLAEATGNNPDVYGIFTAPHDTAPHVTHDEAHDEESDTADTALDDTDVDSTADNIAANLLAVSSNDVAVGCWRDRYICPSQGRYFGDRGSFVDFFDPLNGDEDLCVEHNVAPYGPMVVWCVMSTFDCEEGCEFFDAVLEEGVTSIPVLFKRDPFGDLQDIISDRFMPEYGLQRGGRRRSHSM